MDDLLVQDGSYYDPSREPVEQKREKRELDSKAKAAKPMVEDIITRLNADLKDLESIQVARTEATGSGKSIEVVIEAMDMAHKRLTGMKEYLEGLITE
jgi:hypothetical protein